MPIVGIRGGSESPVIGSGSRRGEASLDDSPSMLQNETNTSRTEKPGALFTPLSVTSRRNNDKREVIASTPNTAYETPTRRFRTPSKFVFLSDRKSVPTELKNLQERTIKRRRDFLARMHNLNFIHPMLAFRVNTCLRPHRVQIQK